MADPWANRAVTPQAPGPTTAVLPPAGWYRDPWEAAWWRWWDGSAWTGYVSGPTVAAPAAAGPGGPSSDVRGPVSQAPSGDWGSHGAPRVQAGGLAALGLLTGVVLANLIVLLWTAAGGSSASAGVLLLSEVGIWTGMVGSCVVASRRKGSGSLVTDFGLRARWVDGGIGFAAALGGRLLVGVITLILIAIFGHRLSGSNVTEFTRHHDALSFLVAGLILCVGAPFVEELYFRGLVQGTLARRLGGGRAVLGQAALFGLVHLTPSLGMANITVFIAIGTFGAIQGWIRWRTGRLGPTIASHAMFNLAGFVSIVAT